MANKNNATNQDDNFAERHTDELSAKRFATVRGFQILLPLATMGIGGVLGYFTLGKPLHKMAPRLFNSSGIVETIWKLDLQAVSRAFEKAQSLAPELIGRVQKANPNLTLQSREGLQTILKSASNEEWKAITKELGMTNEKGLHAAKWGGAFALGTIGSIGGSVFVGYDDWRKEESARLAASEIDKAISKLELFKPSDPELVAENKRLRHMIAEAEKKRPAADTPKEHRPTHAISAVEHHGRQLEHAQQLG